MHNTCCKDCIAMLELLCIKAWSKRHLLSNAALNNPAQRLLLSSGRPGMLSKSQIKATRTSAISRLGLTHGIQGTASLVPCDLVVIECLVDCEREILAIWLLHLHL